MRRTVYERVRTEPAETDKRKLRETTDSFQKRIGQEIMIDKFTERFTEYVELI